MEDNCCGIFSGTEKYEKSEQTVEKDGDDEMR